MEQKNNNTSILFKGLILVGFLSFVCFWVYANIVTHHLSQNTNTKQLFAALYGVVSLLGGAIGLVASKRWGGFHSQIGRALLFFSIGLFAQEFGQLAYSFYIYALKIDIPYPSWGDLGYFSSVLFYIYAAWQLAKAVGIRFSLKDTGRKVIATVIPLVLLAGCYMYFLKGYSFNWHHPLTIFLDFGYPLGQAIYLIIALMTYLFSKSLLGGVMKNRILILLAALLVQYISDFSFLYQAKHNSWTAGGTNDLTYLVSYTVMSLSLLGFISVFAKLRASIPVSETKEVSSEAS